MIISVSFVPQVSYVKIVSLFNLLVVKVVFDLKKRIWLVIFHGPVNAWFDFFFCLTVKAPLEVPTIST